MIIQWSLTLVNAQNVVLNALLVNPAQHSAYLALRISISMTTSAIQNAPKATRQTINVNVLWADWSVRSDMT